MKIGELEQHCGECEIIEFCGNGFCYCICNQKRFENVDTEIYKKYAEKVTTKEYGACCGCQKEDCETCEVDDDARDYYCKQVAEYVASTILT